MADSSFINVHLQARFDHPQCFDLVIILVIKWQITWWRQQPKRAKPIFLRIPILGHRLKPISMEIQDCQDIQTEPRDTLGRHAPRLRRVCSAQREGVNPKRRSDARAEEHSCRDDGKTRACFEESEQTFQMCHLEPAGFKAAAEGSLGPGSASLPSSGQPHAHCSSVFISTLFRFSSANLGLLWENVCVATFPQTGLCVWTQSWKWKLSCWFEAIVSCSQTQILACVLASVEPPWNSFSVVESRFGMFNCFSIASVHRFICKCSSSQA